RVHPDRPPPRAAGRGRDRGDVPHLGGRHRLGQGQGPGDRPRAVDHGDRDQRPHRGRDPSHDRREQGLHDRGALDAGVREAPAAGGAAARRDRIAVPARLGDHQRVRFRAGRGQEGALGVREGAPCDLGEGAGAARGVERGAHAHAQHVQGRRLEDEDRVKNGAPGKGESAAQALLERGLERYGAGDLTAALADWAEALKLQPELTQAQEYIDYVRDNFEALTEQFAAAGVYDLTPYATPLPPAPGDELLDGLAEVEAGLESALDEASAAIPDEA